jgi:hypothetical protein
MSTTYMPVWKVRHKGEFVGSVATRLADDFPTLAGNVFETRLQSCPGVGGR